MSIFEQRRDANWRQGVLLVFAFCAPSLALSSILPSVPLMREAFAGEEYGATLASLIVVAPALAFAITGPFAGYLGDRIGRRRCLTTSAIAFAILGSLPYFLRDIYWMVAARAMTGIALAGITASAGAQTGDYFTGDRLQRWLALQVVANSIFGMLTAVVAGVLAEIDWQLPFLMMALGGGLWLALILTPPPTIVSAAIEPSTSRGAKVLTGQFLFLLVISLLSALLNFQALFQVGLLMQEKHIGSTAAIGAVTAALSAGGIAGAALSGMCKRLSPLAELGMAFVIAGAGAAMLWAATDISMIFVGAAVIGVAQGITLPVLTGWVLSITPPAQRGNAVGMFQSIFFLGLFASPLLAELLARQFGGAEDGMLSYVFLGAAAGIGAIAVGTVMSACKPSE